MCNGFACGGVGSLGEVDGLEEEDVGDGVAVEDMEPYVYVEMLSLPMPSRTATGISIWHLQVLLVDNGLERFVKLSREERLSRLTWRICGAGVAEVDCERAPWAIGIWSDLTR